MSSAATVRVSVVVAARNAARQIGELLAALAAQTLSPDRFETIVVDDASTDGTAEAARGAGRARVVRLDRHGGAYVARNRGIAEARGEVIAITDADCRPAPDWLERGLAEVEARGADLLAGRIEVPLPPAPTVAEALELARFYDQERLVAGNVASTSNLFIRAAAFERLGRFNERMISAGDSEFSQLAVAAGLTLAYSPEPVVVTAPRRGARALARKCFRIGFGMGQLRHVGRGAARRQPQLWSHPRAWRPRGNVARIDRLADAGYRASGARSLQLDAAHYALVQLPMLLGNLAAAIARGRSPLGRSSDQG